MRISVGFPNIGYVEALGEPARLARAIEEIGYDELCMFDHVVMAHASEGRTVEPGLAAMPIGEALVMLAYCAAATTKIGLGTEVLVLPQRDPTLVAKQVASIDTLSGGRVRLGVGVGWQEPEYETLGVAYNERGARMDEAIGLLRRWWSEDPVDASGRFYPVRAMAMEPKPPQGRRLPIWIGGHSPAALRRAGRLGDGWSALRAALDLDQAKRDIATVRRHAEEAGRDPSLIGFLAHLAAQARDDHSWDREFWSDPGRVAASAAKLLDAGFAGVTLNGLAIARSGSGGLDELIDALSALYEAVRREVG